MTIFQAVIIGLIQGLTEILPISSSSHLIIIPTILNWPQQSLSYDVFLQAATLFSIVLYFRKKIWELVSGVIQSFRLKGKELQQSQGITAMQQRRLAINLFFSALPTIPFFILTKSIIDNITNMPVLVISLLILFGIPLLFIVQWYKNNHKNITDLTVKDALLVGVFQSFSLLSGVSRSGITTIGGLVQGLKKEQAQEYAFLAGILTIGGSFALELFKTIHEPLQEPFINLLVSSVVAFVTCYFTIGWVMKFIKQHSLKLFGFYRIIVGIIFLVYLLIR